ncbi:MAG: hypothetical protein NZ576_08220, partial [Bacteroidia bacterium]|nr:hypothetical protein [Bacteroidia bacterium]
MKLPIHHFHNPVLITSVTSVDGRQVIEFTSEAIVHWGWHGKYTRHLPRSYYRDGYLYVVGFQSPFYITHVDVMGVFFDPEQVREFNLCGE